LTGCALIPVPEAVGLAGGSETAEVI
jgi:hypothetical protein